MNRNSFLAVLLVLLWGAYSFGEVHPDTQRISELLKHLPQTVELEIDYRPIVGLASPQSEWYIGQSVFWVRLHPKERYAVEKLDKTKKYNVTGVILEQNYGMVDVWVKSITEKQ